MMRNFFFLFLISSLAALVAGCSSSGSGTNPDGTPKDEQSVNTLPWNKPASWEGQSPIPGASH